MRHFRFLLLSLIFLSTFLVIFVYSRISSYEWRQLVGYTVIDVDYVSDVFEMNYETYIKTGGGHVFSIDEPGIVLEMSDVVILGKNVNDYLFIKLVIDDEIFDATVIE